MGLSIMGVSFAVSYFDGVIESSMLMTSATSGPLLGVFILAMFVPVANWKVRLIRKGVGNGLDFGKLIYVSFARVHRLVWLSATWSPCGSHLDPWPWKNHRYSIWKPAFRSAPTTHSAPIFRLCSPNSKKWALFWVPCVICRIAPKSIMKMIIESCRSMSMILNWKLRKLNRSKYLHSLPRVGGGSRGLLEKTKNLHIKKDRKNF